MTVFLNLFFMSLLCLSSLSVVHAFSLKDELSEEEFNQHILDVVNQQRDLMIEAGSAKTIMALIPSRTELFLGKARELREFGLYRSTISGFLKSLTISDFDCFEEWVNSDNKRINFFINFQLFDALCQLSDAFSGIHQEAWFREGFSEKIPNEEVRILYYGAFNKCSKFIEFWHAVMQSSIEKLIRSEFLGNLEGACQDVEEVEIPNRLLETIIDVEGFVYGNPRSDDTVLLLEEKFQTLTAQEVEQEEASTAVTPVAREEDKLEGMVFFVAHYLRQGGVDYDRFLDTATGEIVGDLGTLLVGMNAFFAAQEDKSLREGYGAMSWTEKKVESVIKNDIFMLDD